MRRDEMRREVERSGEKRSEVKRRDEEMRR